MLLDLRICYQVSEVPGFEQVLLALIRLDSASGQVLTARLGTKAEGSTKKLILVTARAYMTDQCTLQADSSMHPLNETLVPEKSQP